MNEVVFRIQFYILGKPLFANWRDNEGVFRYLSNQQTIVSLECKTESEEQLRPSRFTS